MALLFVAPWLIVRFDLSLLLVFLTAQSLPFRLHLVLPNLTAVIAAPIEFAPGVAVIVQHVRYSIPLLAIGH